MRAKMKCVGVAQLCPGDARVEAVRFEPAVDPVNDAWCAPGVGTPSGHIELLISEPAMLGHFKAGTLYNVDFYAEPQPPPAE